MAKESSTWFDVDRAGLGQVLADREPSRIIAELIANAWDEDVTSVTVALEDAGRGLTRVIVEDDSPTGFIDLTDSYTMFAPSKKKGEAQKRGRFSLGEKVVLSQCESAEISSTTGTVSFNANGSRTVLRRKRERGSKFDGVMRMNASDRAIAVKELQLLIAPVPTTINGVAIAPRKIVASAEVYLPTITVNEEGGLRRKPRSLTTINVYEPTGHGDERGMIHEMGVPVVAVGDRYDVDVLQKVPLTIDRQNVTTQFLRAMRAEVLNITAHLLDESEAAKSWVADALPKADNAAVTAVVRTRFGEKAVTFDPSDPESRSTAEYNGFSIVHGGVFSADAWDAIRRAGALVPASSIFPTHGEKVPGTRIESSQWTAGMHYVARIAQTLADHLIARKLKITMLRSPEATVAADYNPGSCELRFNVSMLTESFFDINRLAEIFDLLIHELSHHLEEDHRSHAYHAVLTKFGGKVAVLCLNKPGLFAWSATE